MNDMKDIINRLCDLERRMAKIETQAIEQAEKQEPVAFETWLSRQHGDPEEIGFLQALKISYEAGQDSAPPKREWVGLTVRDYHEFLNLSGFDAFKAIEAKLRERNT